MILQILSDGAVSATWVLTGVASLFTIFLGRMLWKLEKKTEKHGEDIARHDERLDGHDEDISRLNDR